MLSIQKLIVKDDTIMELMENSATQGLESARNLNRLVQLKDQSITLEEFAAARRKEKQITKDIGQRLVKALVTSIDREDLEALSNTLYKIPKTIEKFAERYLIIAKEVKGYDFSPQVYLLEAATSHVVEIVQALKQNADMEKIESINQRLQQVEGDADKLMLELIKDLYSGKYSPLQLVVLKDLQELIERSIDRCRDAGNAVMQIVFKHS